MRLRITRIGSHPTIVFAENEFRKYVHLIDPRFSVDSFSCDSYSEYLSAPADSIVIGVGLDVEEKFDDMIHISTQDGIGVVTGSNPRSVLIAVYKYFYELGCRYPSPEPGGDYIPKKRLDISDFSVVKTETPSYRHRGIVLEGCVDYSISANCINWMPKLGLNSFFIQYLHPKQYFARVYNHYGEDLSIPESDRIQKRLVEEIKLRDMLYHAVGHTWQCDPFGIPGDTYGKRDESFVIPEEARKYLALVNGKRELYENNPLATSVCYSNPEARRIMIEAVARYCKAHPEVDYLHFWLSDGTNALCECENCRDHVVADLYVQILNEMDTYLTSQNIPTQIVFLCYSDLTWAPIKERIKNPDRFVFMATIAHSYSKPINDFDREPILTPFKLNKNRVPKNNVDSYAMVHEWQKIFPGDSFLFDYNQIWDHYKDPGYMKCAERIAGDNQQLKNLKIDGLHSCQLLQVGFPSWLPTYTHGITLWDDSRQFAEISDEYFKATFGETYALAQSWLTELSDRFDPPYLRHEVPELSNEYVARYSALKNDIEKKMPELELLSKTSQAWHRLFLHAGLCKLLAEALAYRAAGNGKMLLVIIQQIRDAAYAIYDETLGCFDPLIYEGVMGMILTSELTTFARVVETEY